MLKKNKCNIEFFLFNNKFASIGIGAMIVFIAMVLVAGIAASVLIQTSNTLEVKAMQTGHETKDEVSSGIGVVQIIGQYGTRQIGGVPYSRYHNMSIIVTSRAGGSGINLDEVFILITNSSKKCVLNWDSSKFSSSSSGNGLFNTGDLFDLGADDFGIISIEDGDGSCTSDNPVINRGDKAALCINLSACFNGFRGREDIRGMVINEQGAPGIYLFRTPAISINTVVEFM